jgi:cyclohexyl-isocyanide hydratase
MNDAPLRFGLLLFPQVMQLDLTGPAEVFGQVPGAELHLIWKTLDPVPTSKGWRIVPTTTFEACPQLDVVCVPGGSGQIAVMDDGPTLDFLRRQADGARYVTSVCTGSLVLAAAGLLAGYHATSHWMARDQLAMLGAIPVDARIVKDRDRITGGGVTAGIDFGLTVVAELCGEDVAKLIQLGIEYDPAPPFRAGSPERAGPDLVARAQRASEPKQAARLAATQTAARRLKLSAD